MISISLIVSLFGRFWLQELFAFHRFIAAIVHIFRSLILYALNAFTSYATHLPNMS